MCCVCQWLLCDDFSGCHCDRLIREEVEKNKETEENWEKRKQKIHKAFCAVQKPHQAHVKWRELRVVESLGSMLLFNSQTAVFQQVPSCCLWWLMTCGLSVAFGFPQRCYAFFWGVLNCTVGYQGENVTLFFPACALSIGEHYNNITQHCL